MRTGSLGAALVLGLTLLIAGCGGQSPGPGDGRGSTAPSGARTIPFTTISETGPVVRTVSALFAATSVAQLEGAVDGTGALPRSSECPSATNRYCWSVQNPPDRSIFIALVIAPQGGCAKTVLSTAYLLGSQLTLVESTTNPQSPGTLCPHFLLAYHLSMVAVPRTALPSSPLTVVVTHAQYPTTRVDAQTTIDLG